MIKRTRKYHRRWNILVLYSVCLGCSLTALPPAPHSDAPWCTVAHKQLSGRVSLCRECFVFSCVNRELGQPPFTDTVDLISPHWLYIFNGLVSVLSGSSSSEQIVVTVLNGAAPNDCFWNQSLAFFNSLNNHRPIPIRTCWKINYILFKDAEESVMLNSNYSNLSLLKTTVSAIYIYIIHFQSVAFVLLFFNYIIPIGSIPAVEPMQSKVMN